MKLALLLAVALATVAGDGGIPSTAAPPEPLNAAAELALAAAGSVEFSEAFARGPICGFALRCDLPGSYIGQPCNYPDPPDIPPCFCQDLTRFGCEP